MAFSAGNGRKGPMAEINVTPLVDVMLVLLVIFMITAPLMLNGISLDLPKTKEANPINLNTSQVILSISKSEELYVGQEKVLENELVSELQAKFKETKSDTLFLRADFALTYGKVAKLMSFLKSSGITKIALVTELQK
tara:strand:- start:6725 stop:7138 length:414 start_codon:yes stop_codon:yes gene_type:complete